MTVTINAITSNYCVIHCALSTTDWPFLTLTLAGVHKHHWYCQRPATHAARVSWSATSWLECVPISTGCCCWWNARHHWNSQLNNCELDRIEIRWFYCQWWWNGGRARAVTCHSGLSQSAVTIDCHNRLSLSTVTINCHNQLSRSTVWPVVRQTRARFQSINCVQLCVCVVDGKRW